MKNAIEKALSGGYQIHGDLTIEELDNYSPLEVCVTMKEVLFLDPLFWQALGKAIGWSEYAVCIACERDDCDHVDGYKVKWLVTWHRFIDHLASGGDADSFFNELLTPSNSISV